MEFDYREFSNDIQDEQLLKRMKTENMIVYWLLR